MLTVSRRLVIAAISLLALSVGAHAQNPFFQPPAYAGTGQTVTADFNRDGKPDLVTLDGTVQLGNGDGTFKTGTPWTTGQSFTGQTSIAVGDFNGDGKPDLAVSAGTSLYILLGNGDGTFQTATGTNIGTSLSVLVVADVNGDGKPDVLGLASFIFVFLGKGDGTLMPSPSYPTGASVMIVGDFNGDGKLDIATASADNSATSPTTVGVLLGNGDGTFSSTATSSTGVAGPVALAAGDFNGDGKLDLALADENTSQTFILLGNGNGAFQTPGSAVPGNGPLAVTDLNGDGTLDLIVASGLFAEIFLGKGDGAFALKDSYGYGQAVSALIADFNGDGRTDLAAGNVVLLGNSDGSFRGNSAITVGGLDETTPGVTGDFNGDGSTDVVELSHSPFAVVDVLLNDGTGKFSLAHTYTLSSFANYFATADLNGDGNLDLVMPVYDGTGQASLVVLLGNGDGSFGSPTSFALPSGTLGAGQVYIADLNGDHKPDVVFLSQTELWVFLGKGDGTFAAPVAYFPGSNPNGFVVADFNNDGIPDIAASAGGGLAILLGKGDGTFQSPTFDNIQVSFLYAVGDLNNDGNEDILTGDMVLLGKGDGTFNAIPSPNIPVTDGVALADFNGDGKLDALSFGPKTGLAVNLGKGDGTFGSPITISTQMVVESAVVADFNRDGRPDVAAAVTIPNSSGVVTLLNVAGLAATDFLVSATVLSPKSVTPGGSGNSTVTLTPIGGFTGSVSLSCTGLPTGANCSFAPTSVSASGASTLTITTASSTPTGTYPVSVTGTSGSLTNSATLSLAIQTLVTPDFAIAAAAPKSAIVTAGQSAAFTLSLTPSGSFSGTVSLSCAITAAATRPPTCSLSSPSVQIGGSGSQSVTATVATSAPTTTGAARPVDLPTPTLPLLWTLSLLSLAWFVSRYQKRQPILIPLLLVLAFASLAGCGGGSSPTPTLVPGTPSGTYTATITATSGSATHTASVQVVVQ